MGAASGITPATETLHRATSRDGTAIAWSTTGEGPPLLVVHGAAGDRSRWAPLLPYLEPSARVHAMDRRGRGESGDTDPYGVDQEFEDVACVVDAIARAAGRPVDVYGHSMGGLCAFGAAVRTTNIRRLVLFEGWPSVDPSAHAIPEAHARRLDAAIASGDRDLALRTFLREAVHLSDQEIDAMRSQPAWRGRLAAAHTIARELRAYASTPLDPAAAARIAVPTLLVTGSVSVDPAARDVEAVAAAIPDARIAVLDGQGHVADTLAPAMFAPPVLAFLRAA